MYRLPPCRNPRLRTTCCHLRRWAMAHGNLSSATPIPTRRPDLACSVSSSRSRKSRPVQIRAQSRWRPGPIASSGVKGRDGGRVDALSGFSSLGFESFDIFSHIAGKDLASGGSGVDTLSSGDGVGGCGEGAGGGGGEGAGGGGGRDGDDGHSGGKDGANKPLWMLLSPADLMRKLLKTLRVLPEIGKDGEVMLSVICCNNAKVRQKSHYSNCFIWFSVVRIYSCHPFCLGSVYYMTSQVQFQIWLHEAVSCCYLLICTILDY